jgi:hypothetical protein
MSKISQPVVKYDSEGQLQINEFRDNDLEQPVMSIRPETVERIQRRTGYGDFTFIDGTIWHYSSEEEGTSILRLESELQFEEDLMGLEPNTVLSAERINEVEEQALQKVLARALPWLPDSIVDRVFPGIDKNNPEAYTHSQSRIRFVVLGKKSFAFMKNTMYGEIRSGISASTKGQLVYGEHPDAGQVITVNMSEKFVIVAKDVDTLVERNDNKYDEDVIAASLERRLIHEINHVIGIAQDLKPPLEEAIVELYALSAYTQTPFNALALDYLRKNAGYKELVLGTSALLKLVAPDISQDDFDAAFIGGDSVAYEKLATAFTQHLGIENAYALNEFSFEDGEEFLEFVDSLLLELT